MTSYCQTPLGTTPASPLDPPLIRKNTWQRAVQRETRPWDWNVVLPRCKVGQSGVWCVWTLDKRVSEGDRRCDSFFPVSHPHKYSIRPSVCLFIRLSFCLSFHPSFHPYIHPLIYPGTFKEPGTMPSLLKYQQKPGVSGLPGPPSWSGFSGLLCLGDS